VGQLWPLILARAAVEPSRRHVVSVFIDEVQDYLSLPGSLADALAQARSLGAAFHLAHQYRGQLPAALKAGIDANARNKIIFSLSAADAAELARQAIGLEAADFQLLAQYQAYATVMHQGSRSGWFSLATRPAPPAVRDPALLYAASHARYGIPANQTEAELIALTSSTTPSAVDANEQCNPTTTLPDMTADATAATAGDVTSDGPEGEAAGDLKPATLDETEADGFESGAESGRSRPAIGRRRRP
jgi:hypothetical protein